MTSFELYSKDTNQPALTPWRLVQRFHEAPCKFDSATNKTSFEIMQVNSATEFARFVRVVITRFCLVCVCARARSCAPYACHHHGALSFVCLYDTHAQPHTHSTVSGGPARIAEVHFFGGLAPALVDARVDVGR